MVKLSALAFGRKGGACALPAVCAAAAVLAIVGFEAKPAAAQGFFSWFGDDRPRIRPARDWRPRARFHHPRTARHPHGHGGSKAAGAPSAGEAKPAEATKLQRPLFAVVSIADQHVSIYNHDGLVARSAVSTGMAGHSTPKGIFTIIGRERFHASNIYSGAPMPFMQRITWSGIAMHLGVVPGHPASHGCIRLPAGFAVKLWGLTKIGERVVISPQEAAPAEIAHPLLPTPKMRAQTDADETAALAPASPQAVAAAQPALLNPHQYAEQLKAKAARDAAAAARAIKETSAAVRIKETEVARAAAALKMAEAGHDFAQANAGATVKAYEAATAAAGAKQQEFVEAAAKPMASESDASSGAKSFRLITAYEKAVAAKNAATIAKANAGAALADAAAKLEPAKAVSAAKAAELTDAVRRANEATAALEAAANAEKDAVRRLSPVSVLVSKKDRRIYVRQGLAPIFDAPANVRDPETPLGSHLYIATAAKEDGASLKWSVVSMPARAAEQPSERRRRTASIDEQIGAPRRSASSPAEALDRIEIAQDVLDRIAERLWTGGSLIISDQPPSGETGAVGTDLTVKAR